jgi:adenylate cyclase
VKRNLVRVILGFAITLFFVGHVIGHYTGYNVGFIDQLDDIIYDTRLRMTMPERGDPGIVILDIDEKSLAEVGRWPWSRNLMARLMDRLFDEYQVALVAFDVVWAERDPSSGMDSLDALAKKELRDDSRFLSSYRQLRAQLDYDALFAASMKGRAVVLGYFLASEDNALRLNAIPPPALESDGFGGRAVRITE